MDGQVQQKRAMKGNKSSSVQWCDNLISDQHQHGDMKAMGTTTVSTSTLFLPHSMNRVTIRCSSSSFYIFYWQLIDLGPRV